MHWIRSGDGTPQSCTSAILEIDVAFGSKNPTDVSQLAALAVGVSKISFHIIESLFHKIVSILTFLANMTLEIISIVWSIIASIALVIIWSIAKLWNKLFKKDSSSEKE